MPRTTSNADRNAVSILPKRHEDDKIKFTTGKIEGTRYALAKDGSCRNIDPRRLTKKERKRDQRIQDQYPKGVGFRFLCTCKALTFHFPSHTRVRPKGYEQMVRVESYECTACGEHFSKDYVDGAIAAHNDRKKKEEENAKHDDANQRPDGQVHHGGIPGDPPLHGPGGIPPTERGD